MMLLLSNTWAMLNNFAAEYRIQQRVVIQQGRIQNGRMGGGKVNLFANLHAESVNIAYLEGGAPG